MTSGRGSSRWSSPTICLPAVSCRCGGGSRRRDRKPKARRPHHCSDQKAPDEAFHLGFLYAANQNLSPAPFGAFLLGDPPRDRLLLIDVLSDGGNPRSKPPDMFHRFVGRTQVVAGNRYIADIPDVLNAFGRTEISAEHRASEAAEKTSGQFKLRDLILGTVGDVVQNRCALFFIRSTSQFQRSCASSFNSSPLTICSRRC